MIKIMKSDTLICTTGLSWLENGVLLFMQWFVHVIIEMGNV